MSDKGWVFETRSTGYAQGLDIYLRDEHYPLRPTLHYELEGFPGARSGLAWMRVGVALELKNIQSTVRRLRRIEPSDIGAE